MRQCLLVLTGIGIGVMLAAPIHGTIAPTGIPVGKDHFDALRFGLAWFLPIVKRFRHILAEILLISAFIQLVGLVAPLFTQVVIDKVLVHRGLTTLEVLVIGLVVVAVADVPVVTGAWSLEAGWSS